MRPSLFITYDPEWIRILDLLTRPVSTRMPFSCNINRDLRAILEIGRLLKLVWKNDNSHHGKRAYRRIADGLCPYA